MKLIILIIVFCFSFFFSSYAQEEITLTTFYPSPIGVYQRLEVITGATDQHIVLIGGDDNHPRIVLRSTDAAATPHIDFRRGDETDYDLRMSLQTANNFWIQGAEVFVAHKDDSPGRIRTGELYLCGSY